ncbi:MarR family winged helix-turn-helix transcriptional regulator [Flindersiella endophytica]
MVEGVEGGAEESAQAAQEHALHRRIGYALRRADAALRGAMESALRVYDLTLPQYACLDLLDQRPGLSGAELARGAFVTRQSMHQVLQGLQTAGLVERDAVSTRGRALPAKLTSHGRKRLTKARTAIVAIEQRMASGLPEAGQHRLLADLDTITACVLARPAETPGTAGPVAQSNLSEPGETG